MNAGWHRSARCQPLFVSLPAERARRRQARAAGDARARSAMYSDRGHGSARPATSYAYTHRTDAERRALRSA